METNEGAWLKGRKPFRYENAPLTDPATALDARYVIRDADDLWIALCPVEAWAVTITKLLNEAKET